MAGRGAGSTLSTVRDSEIIFEPPASPAPPGRAGRARCSSIYFCQCRSVPRMPSAQSHAKLMQVCRPLPCIR